MAEYKEVRMEHAGPDGRPDWGKAYGREFLQYKWLLNYAVETAPEDLDECNKYLNVLKDELIPIFIRYRKAFPEQIYEVLALCAKYDHEDTGLFTVLAKDLDTFMESGPTRYPDLWPILTEIMKEDSCVNEMRGIRHHRGSKIIFPLEKGEPEVAINYGNRIRGDGLIIKAYQSLCSRLDKKSTLQQEQTQLLKQLLADNGLQLPPEFATNQQQLDDLERPRTEEELAQTNMDKGEDACPDAQSFEIFEGVRGSGQFIGFYQNMAKPFVLEPPPPPEFDIGLCSKLMKHLRNCDFIKPFMQRPTEKEAPGYSKVVTRHRDIPMIRSSLSHAWQMGTLRTQYEGPAFMADLRLMIENYYRVFDEGSHQYDCAQRLEAETYKKLVEFGAAGETGKKLFDEPALLDLNGPEPEGDANILGLNGPEPEGDADITPETSNTLATPAARLLRFENSTPFGTSSPFSRRDKTLNILEKAWKVRHEALQNGKNVAEPEENADVSLHTIHDDDTPVARILEYKDTPRAQPSPSSGRDNTGRDNTPNTLDRAWKLMDEALQYDKNAGNPTRAPVRPRDTQQPGASSSAQPPRPNLDDDETGEQTAGDHSFFDQFDYPDPNATGFGPPPEATTDEQVADDTFGSLQLSSDSLEAQPTAAGDASPDNTLGSIPNPYSDELSFWSDDGNEAGEEGIRASAQAFHQAAPIAPMVAETQTIDLTSSPQGQATHTSSAANKRARDSDDQEDSAESDDDAPLVKKRKILAVKASASAAAAKGKAPVSAAAKGKTPASASASSSRKRRRDDSDADSDDDADSDYVPEQPSKRSRKTPSKDNTAAAAAKGKAPATASSQPKTSTAASKGKGKAPAAPVASSSRKRSRDDDDDDDADDHAADQSSKRQKPASASAQEPVPTEPVPAVPVPAVPAEPASAEPVAAEPAAAGGNEPHLPEEYQHLKEILGRAVEIQRQQQLQDQDPFAHLPPSPEYEPLTPERAASPERADADGYRSMSPERAEPVVAGPSNQAAAADQPPPEPATTALGHTDQGTITVLQLQRMPKYRKTANTNGTIRNRPWVFGYSFGDQYGLYVMRCPTKGCPKKRFETGPEAFSKHPLRDNDPACHLNDCCGDFGGGDDDTMVRKYCKQVISDNKKAVSIEWARKWNNDLIDEYGNYPDNDLREHNVF